MKKHNYLISVGSKVVVSLLVFFTIFIMKSLMVLAQPISGTSYQMDEGAKYVFGSGSRVYNDYSYGQSSLVKISIGDSLYENATYNGYTAYGVSGGVRFWYFPVSESFQTDDPEEWNLITDAGKSVNGISLSQKINKGVFIVQKSSDGSTWTLESVSEIATHLSDPKIKTSPYYATDDDVKSGMYYRITVAYKMGKKTGEEHYPFSWSPYVRDIYRYIECVEVYEFYLCYGNDSVELINVDNYNAITSGSVQNGFYIDKCGTDIDVSISKDGGRASSVQDKEAFYSKGSYKITVTTSIGISYERNITVTKGLTTKEISPLVYVGDKKNGYTCDNLLNGTTVFLDKSLTSLKIAQPDGNTYTQSTYNGYDGYGLSGDGVKIILNLTNGDGINYDNWEVISDTWGKNSDETIEDVKTESIGTGALIIQKSYDGVVWTNAVTYTTDYYNNFKNYGDRCIYEPSGNDVLKGVYIRIAFAYEVQQNGKTSTNTRYLEKYNLYLCSNNLDAVTFHNKSVTAEDIKMLGDADSNSIEIYTRAETLTSGSNTVTGFTIDTSGNSAVIISVKKDGDDVSIPANKTFTSPGRYVIYRTSPVGDVDSVEIYVDTASNEDAYNRYFENSFITGKRIYKEGDYPVYEANGELEYYIASVENCYLPLSGEIVNLTTNEKITIEGTRSEKRGIIHTAGIYCATFTTNSEYDSNRESGDKRVYRFNFEVIEEGTAPGPVLNENELENVYAHSTFVDMYPIYYGVTYASAGSGRITFAFATYQEAREYAYECEKGYVEVQADGSYRYNGSMCVGQKEHYESNWDLIDAIYYFVDQAVEKCCFDHSDPFTYLTLSDDVLRQYSGHLRTLELSRSVVVFADGQKELLSNIDGLPIINNKEYMYLTVGLNGVPLYCEAEFMFVSDKYACDSAKVVIVDSDGNEYPIDYMKSVGTQLEAYGLKSGIINIIEETIYGDKNEYEAVYIAKDDNTSVTTISYYDSAGIYEQKITKADTGIVINTEAWAIDSVIDDLDQYNIIVVKTPDGSEAYFAADQVGRMTWSESGEYKVRVTNRLGYSYEFMINVVDSTYSSIIFSGEGTEELDSIVTSLGSQNINLPSIERYGYDFVCYVDSEGNEYIDTYSNVVSSHSIVLTAVWKPQEYVITYNYEDGSTIDSMTVTFGSEYELMIPEIEDGFMFNGWLLDGVLIGNNIAITTEGDLVLVADISSLSVVDTEETQDQSSVNSGNNTTDNIIVETNSEQTSLEANNTLIIVLICALSFVALAVIGSIIALIIIKKGQVKEKGDRK